MDFKSYKPEDCAVFFKVKEQWGEFSSMSWLAVELNGLKSPWLEGVFQGLKMAHERREWEHYFGKTEELQKEIISQRNGVEAKRKAYEYAFDFRSDWLNISIPVMTYLQEVRFLQNRERMLPVFEASEGMDIVERSGKDQFWGAKFMQTTMGDVLYGSNNLGLIIMGLRDRILSGEEIQAIPPEAPDLTWNGKPLPVVGNEQPTLL